MNIFDSIRCRIQIWQTLLLLVIVTGLGMVWYQNEKERAYFDVDKDLSSRLVMLIRHLPHVGMEHAEDESVREMYRDAVRIRGLKRRETLELTNRPKRAKGPRSRGDRKPRKNSGRGPRGEQQRHVETLTQKMNAEIFTSSDYSLCVWKDGVVQFEDEYTGVRSTPDLKPTASGAYRTVENRREIIGENPHKEIVLLGYDMGIVHEDLASLRWNLVLAGGLVVLAGFILGWIATGRAVKPIVEVNRVSQSIAEGDLSERIKLKNSTSEMRSLSKALNSTFDELEQTIEHLKRFTADASHELRNPLASMLMEVEVALEGGSQDAETRGSLELCKRNLEGMTDLVQSLLSLAKLDAGTVDSQRERDDLAAVVDIVTERYIEIADERGLTLIIEAESAPCIIVLGQMIQVLDNLLSNAFKYGLEGGVVTVCSGQEGENVFLSVRNEGEGIAAEDLPRIFERFYRADDSRTHKEGSVGIGLAIVQSLVKANGGTVEVDSELGKGATFTVIFPKSPLT